jgi:hypothetical protein
MTRPYDVITQASMLAPLLQLPSIFAVSNHECGRIGVEAHEFWQCFDEEIDGMVLEAERPGIGNHASSR